MSDMVLEERIHSKSSRQPRYKRTKEELESLGHNTLKSLIELQLTQGDKAKGIRKVINTGSKTREIIDPYPKFKSMLRIVKTWFKYKVIAIHRECCIGGQPRRSRFSLTNGTSRIRSLIHGPDYSDLSMNSGRPDSLVMIKIDLKDAFHSIHASSIATVFDKWVQRVLPHKDACGYQVDPSVILIREHRNELAEALCYNRYLAVGFPTSTLLFNAVMSKVDSRILGLLGSLRKNSPEAYIVHGFTYKPVYYRFIDDLTIICHKNHAWVVETIKSILRSEGLNVNGRKLEVVRCQSGWSTLGISPSSKLYYAPKKMRRKLRYLAWRRDTRGDFKAAQSVDGLINSIPIMEFREYLKSLVGIKYIPKKLADV